MGRLFLCKRSELGPGVQIVFHLTGTAPRKSILVIATKQGPKAYWNVCKHLPVPLDSGAGHLAMRGDLVCLTHGARYRRTDGLCVEGPCEGESLDPVPIEAEGDELYAITEDVAPR